MHILCIMHAEFETPGVIENWAHDNHHHFSICKPYQGENCLKTPAYDLLIIMGGPQSPLEIEKAPYLKDEMMLIQHAISQDKMILGFCLGAQLIGEALGAKTQKSPEKEVGVFPIFLTEEGKNDLLLQGFPDQFPVIHWHNDMPGETKNSKILAYSEGCPRQIIRYAPKIIGFQCHMEMMLAGVEKMINACQSDLKPSLFTQASPILRTQDYGAINTMMFQILDRFISMEYRSEDEKIAI